MEIETVLGPIRFTEILKILPHEHLTINCESFYKPPPKNLESVLDNSIHLHNVGFIQQYPYSNKYNLTLNDVESKDHILEDLKLYKEMGGNTIVECTSNGLDRNVAAMKNLSMKSGINIIAGTGYYTANVQNVSVLHKTTEELYDAMLKELTIHCHECHDVKAGCIGEVGCSWPLDEFEKRSIQATAQVQSQLHCAVSLSPGRNPQAPDEIMRIYQEAGGKSEMVAMCHVERTFKEKYQIQAFARKYKCYFQFDGMDADYNYSYNSSKSDLPCIHTINGILALRESKFLSRVLLSNDIHTKHKLTSWGGTGYGGIIQVLKPLMKNKPFSFTIEEIEIITNRNPKAWLKHK